ncbi:MAG: ABC transporter ATP-binding protein [Flavobacteriaceae bacterium]|nr:MAG: ABC transporter ATP-binding protein [Flavobacteriaceae bacterium]
MIHLKKMTFFYDKKQPSLFQNVDFYQPTGNIIGLFGANGAGKSTLLKLIAGLIRPKEGSIKVNDYLPSNRDPRFLQEIFLIDEELFLPDLSIKRYISMLAPLYPKFGHDKMNQILADFGLQSSDHLKKLSMGQQKKFIIAFGLSTNCKLLLLDEPTNGLDIPSKKIFRKVLVNAIEEDQLVIISTHQVKDIENIIDKIVILDQGKIAFSEELTQITRKLQFKHVFEEMDKNDAIYTEKCFEGYKVILPVENQEETAIDIELLFNAVNNDTKITM